MRKFQKSAGLPKVTALFLCGNTVEKHREDSHTKKAFHRPPLHIHNGLWKTHSYFPFTAAVMSRMISASSGSFFMVVFTRLTLLMTVE